MVEDSKTYVLKKFSGAQAYFDEDHGDGWCVYDDTVEHGLNTILGWGDSAETAWLDAAKRIASKQENH